MTYQLGTRSLEVGQGSFVTLIL